MAKSLGDIMIVNDSLVSICTDMGYRIVRAACSTTLNEVTDFSCAIFDAKLRQVAQATHIPVHLGELPYAVRNTIGPIIKEVNPGDVIVLNDPHVGKVPHLADWCFITPVFYRDELVFFTVNVAHHMDVGGSVPGTYAFGATDIFAEGFRIPPVKVFDRGQLNEGIFDMMLANTRTPDDQRKDFYAQVSANEYGKQRIVEFLEKYGKDHVTATIEDILDYSERWMRSEIEDIPDGTYSFQDYVEGDGISEDILTVKATLTIKGSEAYVDFTGTSPQVRGNINNNLGRITSATYIAFVNFTEPEIPRNAGRYRPIHIHAPEGCLVNCVFPAATSVSHEVAARAIDCVLRCLGQAVPERAIGAQGASPHDTIFYGKDWSGKRNFVHLQLCWEGWGARKTKDGLTARGTIFGGKAGLIPVEISETRGRIRFHRYEIKPDTGGPGTSRGGLGGRYLAEYVGDEPGMLIIGGDRHKIAPPGIFGGGDGAKGLYLLHSDGETRDLGVKKVYRIKKGDRVEVFYPGGGGYGDPLQRDPAKVQEDLQNGFITLDHAREAYGFTGEPVI